MEKTSQSKPKAKAKPTSKRSAKATQTASDEYDLVFLVKKLQQHLVYLEKKIDTLIEASSRKPYDGANRKPYGEKRFSKPSHSGGGGGYPRRHTSPGGGNRYSGERNSERVSSFDSFRGGQSDRSGRKKKRPFQSKKSRH